MIMVLFAAVAAMKVLQGVMAFQQQRQAGTVAKQAGEYQNTLAMRRAESMEARAGEERAAAQRRMMEQRRQGRFATSRAKALGAASGTSLDSPSMVNIFGDIETEAQYRSDVEKYKGEAAGRGLEYQAVVERAQGKNARYQGQVEDRLAKQRASQALIGGITGAAQTAVGAYTAGGFGADPGVGATGSGFQTQTLMQQSGGSMQGGSGSLFAKYGQGGYQNSVYP